MNDGGPAFPAITEIKSTVVGDQVINFDVVYTSGESLPVRFAGPMLVAMM
ncbi:MAG: hypothetical protein IIC00_15010, partial [Planctomycetes bacterium]|nr:hypothetical protein [Planctomycetota bacterium]